MQSTMMKGPLLVKHLLERAERVFPDVPICSRLPDKSLFHYDYQSMCRRARQLARALLNLGLSPGDRVASFLWNNHLHLEAYLGVPVAGLVLHTLNLRLHPDEIAYIANHAEDQVLIIEDTLLPLFSQFRDKTAFKHVIVARLAHHAISPEFLDYEDLIAKTEPLDPLPEMDEETACGMCYTSGTTGKPKGVVYSHRSTVLHAMALLLADSAAISMRDKVMPIVPMFHVNAWGMPYGATLAGAAQVFPDAHMSGEDIVELFEQEQVTLSAAVPTIWLRVLESLQKSGAKALAPNLRVICGGSAPPEGLIRGLDRFGVRLMQLWGMTETSPAALVCALHPELDHVSEDARYRYRTYQGLPLPLVDLRVQGLDGKEKKPGEGPGEIQVKGPWITGSYFKGEAKEKFTADGWLRTSDIAVLESYGYVHITDRDKDLIKSGGEWISSIQLENAIMAHPLVTEAAVIAIPHEVWGERPLAVVVPKPQAKLTTEELRAFLEPKFPKYWLPEAFEFVDHIPHTSTGKFLKAELRRLYKDYRFQSTSRET